MEVSKSFETPTQKIRKTDLSLKVFRRMNDKVYYLLFLSLVIFMIRRPDSKTNDNILLCDRICKFAIYIV